MLMKHDFEIISVANEYLAVPLGEEAKRFGGIVVLSEPAAFLLKQMKSPKSEKDLIELILQEYDIERSVAEEDIKKILDTFISMNIIE